MIADKDFDNGRTARAVARRFAVFIPIVVVWLVLDQASKLFFNGSYHAGQVISDPILGIFRFHLVYNTGGAWSIFSGATWALGAFSLVVCIALTAYLALTPQHPNAGELIGISLVVAGGIGNAIDRFTLGFGRRLHRADVYRFSYLQYCGHWCDLRNHIIYRVASHP